MNNKDLSLLEFDKVRAIIAGYCTCDESKSIVQSIEPKTDINWINEQLDECCEARYILEHETGINADGLLNVSDEVSKAARDVDPYTPDERLIAFWLGLKLSESVPSI